MNLKKWLLPQLLSLNLHFSTACTFWITICKLKYQSILDIYVRIWIICNDLQNGRHRFQNGWGRLWRISLRIALKFRRDRVWVWGFTSKSIRGVQMLDDAHIVDHAFMMLKDAWDAQSGDNSETECKRNAKLRKATILHPNAWVCQRFGLANLNLKFCVKLARGQSADNSETIKSKPKKKRNCIFRENANFRISEILYYTLHFIRDSLLHASF